jgi:DNA replication and repair protein RecF
VSVDHAVLDALDTQLALLGARLAERRAALLAELAPWVDAMYRTLADADGAVTLELRTTAKGTSEAERAEALMDVFARSREAEIRRRRTLAGPQTDEVAIRLGGRPARRYASRGQVRSLVLALKLAELRAARERGTVPLFLLDDLSSELDRVRTRRLVALLADLGAQVIATTTDPEHVDSLPASDTLRLAVRNGEIGREGPE